MSPTSDVAPSGSLPAFGDEDLLLVGGASEPTVRLGAGHWLAAAGFRPSDIDAFARIPGAAPGSADSVAFSLLSDQDGFRDGDIVRLSANGGVELLFGEDFLASMLGVPGANLDVDAFDFDDFGRLLFSLQSDELGTALGDVLDGDVLRLDAGPMLAIERTEAEIESCFLVATGSSSSILDVQAIDWVGGELLVAVQSPSSHDGGVLSCGAMPAMVLEEADVGLGGAEIDALSIETGEEFAAVTVDPELAPAGTKLDFELRGRPNALLLVLMSGGTGTVGSRWGGFGRWYLDPADPWLASILMSRFKPFVRLDGTGRASVSFTPPAMVDGMGFGGEQGYSFQALEFPSLEICAPVRVEKQ